MRHLRAMVEIVQWSSEMPSIDASIKWETMLLIVTDHLELMVEGMVDDYRVKLHDHAVE